MVDSSELKQALAELFGEDSGYEEKVFFFPRNVNPNYKIVAGLDLKSIIKYIIPTLLLIFLICIIPPYLSVVFWIFKLIIITIIFAIGIMFAFLRPIKTRPNITLMHYIKIQIAFQKRQKVFFTRKRQKLYEV